MNHADESHKRADQLDFEKNIWSVQQICKVGRPILLVFQLYCHQRPITEKTIEIVIFGRSQRLVWTTKQSSNRPTNNIRHVKYFAQKSRRPVDTSATLDAQESILVVGSLNDQTLVCIAVIC